MSSNQFTPVVWFVVGSQHLYGEEALRSVKSNAATVVDGLNAMGLPYKIVLKTIVTRSDEATTICREINNAKDCIGMITWMHTFSPAKMWATGLSLLSKPMLQLHTQLNPNIPWADIDMDFMNLHQTAHGGREFSHISARLRKPYTLAIGHWKEDRVKNKIEMWMQVCAGIDESRKLKVARFGDNMRDVAVTEGDKVEALIKFGFEVDAYTINDLTKAISGISDAEVEKLVALYDDSYTMSDVAKKGGAKRQNVLDAARIELGMRCFLEQGGYRAFSSNFQTLEGMKQLPGLAVQRLMADGYGFGGEGDWKTAALLRIMKAMDPSKGTSFMEDYTYDFNPGNDIALGAHMLEVCPSLAIKSKKPVLDILPLGIGGKDDPARLIFSSAPGDAINVGLMDVGTRFRIILNEVTVIDQPHPLPNLPVACAVWKYKPDFTTGVEAWMLAGGGHHTVLSAGLKSEHLRTFAEELGVECIVIDNSSTVQGIRNELRWNEVSYK